MGKIIPTGIILITFIIVVYAASNCPLRKGSDCKKSCIHDGDCASSGKVCCDTICNHKACTYPDRTGSSDGYKGSGSFGGSTYCGNMKCKSNQKCVLDSQTKRMKCSSY